VCSSDLLLRWRLMKMKAQEPGINFEPLILKPLI
jgi:hypothetical protein